MYTGNAVVRCICLVALTVWPVMTVAQGNNPAAMSPRDPRVPMAPFGGEDPRSTADLLEAMGRKAAPREDGVATGVHAAGDSGSGWPDDDQALFIAAGGGSIEEVLSLIRSGANVDYRDRASGMTPLMTVGTRIQAAVLLAAGADPNIADIQGRTPLHHVLFAREAEVIIPLLMASGAEIDVSAPQSGGETAFLEARQLFFEGRDPEAAERVIRLLAEYGADINAQDSQGDTVLMTAARRDRTGLVRWLLNLGADPGLRNIDGVSAIDIARQEGNEKLVQLLVSR